MESIDFLRDKKGEIDSILAKYPQDSKDSAIMPLLFLAQEYFDNFLSDQAIFAVSKILDMPHIKVVEVASFYTMFNFKPVGKFVIEVCRGTPCWLCGGQIILDSFIEILGINIGQTSSDNMFTLKEIECLGACVDGPVVKINNDYFYLKNKNDVVTILEQLKSSCKS